MSQFAPSPHKLHVAIIMDGNGRWAQARGLPRAAGHVAGVTAVRRVVESAPSRGIEVLTLFAFSSDNWKRPTPEVNALMKLLERFLRSEVTSCVKHGVRVEVIGRRDRLSLRVQDAIAKAERATAGGTTLRLRLAIDYSSRDELVRAAGHAPRSREALVHFLQTAPEAHAPDVDLVIRTGGEQRLSDFLLWESAYAELYFTDVAWPDFDAGAFDSALAEFARRQRRYGGLPPLGQIAAVAS